MRVLPAFVGSLVLLCAAPAIAQPACDSAALLDSDPYPLRVLLAAGADRDKPPPDLSAETWDVQRNQALDTLDALVAACDTTQELVAPQGSVLGSIYSQSVSFQDTLRDAIGGLGEVSPVLSQVLTPPGTGIPMPRRFQLGLSQVFSAGQPGLALNGAGTPFPTDPNKHWRRLNLAISALAIQPIGAAPEEAAPISTVPPQFASAEVALSYRLNRTPYDWMAEIASTGQNIALTKEGDTAGYFATQELIRVYSGARKTSLDANGQLPGDWPQRRQDALAAATESAVKLYRERMKNFLRGGPVADEARRARHPVSFNFSLRFRTTPKMEYVPEVPDARSLSLEGRLEGSILSSTGTRPSPLRFNLGASFAGSSLPRQLCLPRTAECSFGDTLSGVLDAAGGFIVALPGTESNTPTVLRANALFRWAPWRSVLVEGDEKAELSYGFNASLTMPATESFSIVGTYTYRWVKGIGSVSTSGITIAKELAE